MQDQFSHELLEALKALGATLMPAAIGSAVATAWQEGLSLRARCIQWVVGICVSYYVTLGIAAMLEFGPFAEQAIGFVVGMVAFQSAPRFIAGCGAMLETLPAAIRDRFLGAKK